MANVRAASPQQAVKVLGAMRVAIGVAYLVAPRRLGRSEELLMTRSFAVREVVLGVGGLQAGDAAEWARLGALVDAGDVVAAAAAVRRRAPHSGPALLAALAGLAVEGWAARRLAKELRER